MMKTVTLGFCQPFCAIDMAGRWTLTYKLFMNRMPNRYIRREAEVHSHTLANGLWWLQLRRMPYTI